MKFKCVAYWLHVDSHKQQSQRQCNCADQIIPFILVDGQFMQVGAGYSPQILEGMDHAKVRAELANPASPVGKAMKAEIDNITALICKSIGGRAAACSSENIKSLAGRI